jgi:N-acetylglucosamine-6-phosphate deacetylase
MPAKLLKNAHYVQSGQHKVDGRVLVDGDQIVAVGTSTGARQVVDEIDVSRASLLPGFIDMHNHGAFGHDVNSSTAQEMLDVAAFLAKNGVSAWLPTLVPDSDENYERIIGEIDRLMELQEGKPVAQALGVHYEGVFANEAMCGALRPRYFKSGQWSVDGGQLPRLKKGVHMTTLAPEIDGGIDLIKRLVGEGWIVSIGHTKADLATLDAAFEAGARHMTHFFNAMTGIHHRDIGVAGWGLAKTDVSFDIIADGIHVAPQMLKLACETKGIEHVSLISDSVAPTGLGDGEFELWNEKISVTKGRTRNERGSIAGSVITMHDAVREMLRLGFSESDVAKMASSNPAAVLGLGSEIGSIEVGKRADVVALDIDGNIEFTMIGGQMVVK